MTTPKDRRTLLLILCTTAIIYFLSIGLAFCQNVLMAMSCASLQDAIDTANRASSGDEQVSASCEVRPIRVPNDPQLLIPLYITSGQGFTFVVVSATFPKEIRFVIIILNLKPQGQPI